MRTYHYDYRGKSITVEIALLNRRTHWLLYYTDDHSFEHRYQIKGYPVPADGVIQVPYVYTKTFVPTQEVMQVKTGSYVERRIDLFYHMPLPTNGMARGDWDAMLMLNGLVAHAEELGGKPDNPAKGPLLFWPDGSFRQPVVVDILLGSETFTEVVDNQSGETLQVPNQDGSVTVSKVNGEGALSYSLDMGNTWQTDGLFNNLSAGHYTLLVEDQQGTRREEEIEVIAYMPDALMV
jgi:hypothetical protein